MKRALRPLPLVLATTFMLLGVNCGTPPIGTIEYELGWSTERIVSAGGGWTVTTDLGYEVTVQQGWLVSYGLTLLPCEDDPGLARRSAFGVSTAYAGHPGAADRSAFMEPVVQSLSSPVDLHVASVRVPATRYCQAHYLVARSDEDAVRTSTGDMRGTTLLVSGSYRAPGSDRAEELRIRIAAANGGIVGFSNGAPETNVSTGHGDYVVRFERDLGALFDQIEFDDFSAEEIEKQILRNVIDGLRVATQAG